MTKMKHLTLLFILTTFTIHLHAQWILTEQKGIKEGWSNFNKIETDTLGIPYIFYGQSQRLHCRKLTGSTWQPLDSTSLNTFKSVNPTIFKIDKKNRPVLLFEDEETTFPSCIRYEESAWKIVGSKHLLEEYLPPASHTLTVDSAGVVYVAFHNSNGLKIYKESEGKWINLPISGLEDYVSSPWLEFGYDGNLYLAYSNTKLMSSCSKLVAGQWKKVGNQDISSTKGFARYNKLVFTPDKNLYLVCDDFGTSCYWLNSSTNTWKLLGSNGLGGNYDWNTDVVSDDNSHLYIAIDGLGGDKARCLTYSGTDWIQPGNTAISENDATNINFAYSSQDLLYAFYNDYLLSKPVVKKLALTTGIGQAVRSPRVSIYPSPADHTVNIVLPLGEKGTGKIFSMEGQLVLTVPLSGVTSIDTRRLSQGTYFVSVHYNREVFQGKVIIAH